MGTSAPVAGFKAYFLRALRLDDSASMLLVRSGAPTNEILPTQAYSTSARFSSSAFVPVQSPGGF